MIRALWLALALASALTPGLPARAEPPADATPAQPARDRDAERALYRKAQSALQAGDLGTFRAAARELADYPLYPYLDYAARSRRVADLSADDVIKFRERWSDSPLGQRLYDEWLDSLFTRQRYADFLAHYEDDHTVERQCRYLRALLRTGRRAEAMAGVEPLWVVGHSQPTVCDPLFQAWIDDRHLTQSLVWARIEAALNEGQIGLGHFLTRNLTGAAQKHANDFVAVAQRPLLVLQTSRYRDDTPWTRAIVSLGLRRLARIDAEGAKIAWEEYEDRLTFAAADARAIDQEITRALARRGILLAAPDLSPSPGDRHLDTAEAVVIAAVGLGDYARVVQIIDSLEPDERAEVRWRYWRGRAQLAAGVVSDTDIADFRNLAGERQYYGFLAADRLGLPLQLNAREVPDDPEADAALQRMPGMQRIVELYALRELGNARRELRFLLPRLDPRARIAAARDLADMGWIDQSVMSANDPALTDYLSIRFPHPHESLFQAASRATGLPIGYLYGITRQESAFGAAAVSPVGALGLMQLMPATAARTARTIGDAAPPRTSLLQPPVNIRLGSRYLAALMRRYDGNRFLSAAAYNAGEYRVDRWLRERPLTDADVWIDSIPFLETRNYVKAVMSFSYIYGQLLGQPEPFLRPQEKGVNTVATTR